MEEKVIEETVVEEKPDIKIYAVKTIIGRENVVLEAMAEKSRQEV